jgi:hypothetical protein
MTCQTPAESPYLMRAARQPVWWIASQNVGIGLPLHQRCAVTPGIATEGNPRSPPRRAIPEERWLEVAARAGREGLRAVARDLGVSHETVRSVLRSVE